MLSEQLISEKKNKVHFSKYYYAAKVANLQQVRFNLKALSQDWQPLFPIEIFPNTIYILYQSAVIFSGSHKTFTVCKIGKAEISCPKPARMTRPDGAAGRRGLFTTKNFSLIILQNIIF